MGGPKEEPLRITTGESLYLTLFAPPKDTRARRGDAAIAYICQATAAQMLAIVPILSVVQFPWELPLLLCYPDCELVALYLIWNGTGHSLLGLVAAQSHQLANHVTAPLVMQPIWSTMSKCWIGHAYHFLQDHRT